MIKLIIFDLDGVLVEAKTIHYESLNKSLGEKYSIEWNEHLSIYDGLKTNQKLETKRDELQDFYISFEIVVKDSGAGISQENLGKLFLNFSKLKDS